MLGWSSYIEVGTLNPSLHHHCRIPRQNAQQCLKKQSEQEKQRKEAVDGNGNQQSSQHKQKDDDMDSDKQISCSKFATSVTKCEQAVKRAYYQINMSCSQSMHAVALCEQEWCSSSSSRHNGLMQLQQLLQQQQSKNKGADSAAVSQCDTECAGVRGAATKCVQQHVMSQFSRFGLDNDGVLIS